MDAKNENKKNAPKNGRDSRTGFIGVSGTKGWYRFSKNFPSEKSPDGFRRTYDREYDNRGLKKRLAILFSAVLVLSTLIFSLAFAVSKMPLSKGESFTGERTKEIPQGVFRAVYLSGKDLNSDSVSGKIQKLKSAGCNTAVFCFKDRQGHLFVKPEFETPGDAVAGATGDAARTVAAYRAAGFRVFAYVSLFVDDIYARTHRDMAAYTIKSETADVGSRELIYDNGKIGHTRLSPFSPEVIKYLDSFLEKTVATGVDGIILDGVSASGPFESEDAVFPSKNKNDEGAADRMLKYCTEVVKRYSSKTFGVAADCKDVLPELSGGVLPKEFKTGAELGVIKIMSEELTQNISVGNDLFTQPDKTFASFVGAVCQLYSSVSASAGRQNVAIAMSDLEIGYTDNFIYTSVLD